MCKSPRLPGGRYGSCAREGLAGGGLRPPESSLRAGTDSRARPRRGCGQPARCRHPVRRSSRRPWWGGDGGELVEEAPVRRSGMLLGPVSAGRPWGRWRFAGLGAVGLRLVGLRAVGLRAVGLRGRRPLSAFGLRSLWPSGSSTFGPSTFGLVDLRTRRPSGPSTWGRWPLSTVALRRLGGLRAGVRRAACGSGVPWAASGPRNQAYAARPTAKAVPGQPVDNRPTCGQLPPRG